jgi:serine/threonine-protein kinase
MTEQLSRLTAALTDRYRIERELGAGGMATVYLADDLKLHRKVAIKVLRPELAAILGAERFLGEVEVTANLQHPNILPLHDSGDADSFLYHVMPYVEGVSLRDRLHREKQLGVEETIKIAEGVAAALDHAHQHGVIHRDIKPEHILLRDGQAVVADFGIALAVSEAGGTRLTETACRSAHPFVARPTAGAGVSRQNHDGFRCNSPSLQTYSSPGGIGGAAAWLPSPHVSPTTSPTNADRQSRGSHHPCKSRKPCRPGLLADACYDRPAGRTASREAAPRGDGLEE